MHDIASQDLPVSHVSPNLATCFNCSLFLHQFCDTSSGLSSHLIEATGVHCYRHDAVKECENDVE